MLNTVGECRMHIMITILLSQLSGENALHKAVRDGNTELLEMLLSRGADVNNMNKVSISE